MKAEQRSKRLWQPPPPLPPPLPPPRFNQCTATASWNLLLGRYQRERNRHYVEELLWKNSLLETKLVSSPKRFVRKKNYLRKTTRLLNAWVEKSQLLQCSWQQSTLCQLLQKPSKSSKIMLGLWKEDSNYGKKRGLPSAVTWSRCITTTPSKRFLMQQNQNNPWRKETGTGQSKLLTNNMYGGGVLPLNEENISNMTRK